MLLVWPRNLTLRQNLSFSVFFLWGGRRGCECNQVTQKQMLSDWDFSSEKRTGYRSHDRPQKVWGGFSPQLSLACHVPWQPRDNFCDVPAPIRVRQTRRPGTRGIRMWLTPGNRVGKTPWPALIRGNGGEGAMWWPFDSVLGLDPTLRVPAAHHFLLPFSLIWNIIILNYIL